MTRRESHPDDAGVPVRSPGLRPAVALSRRQDVTGRTDAALPRPPASVREAPISEPDVEPAVLIRAVLALIQAERDKAIAGCYEWHHTTGTYYLTRSSEFLGAYDVPGRLEAAVLRLREETL